jgi:hypothetical protein
VLELINSGSILFREGTPLPGGFQMDTAPHSAGWRLVRDQDGYAIGRKAHDKGWTFFCMAGESNATVIGIEGQKKVCKALKRILADRKLRISMLWK